MIKGIIFDLDGLLVDSEPYWKEADFSLAKKYKFPLTDGFRKQLLGRGLKECSEILRHSFKLQENVDVLTRERLKLLYKVLFKKLKLMPFARKLICKLNSQGYVLALATAGHEANMAKKILNKLAVLDYFSHIVSGLEVSKSKPSPDIYFEAAKRMQLLPEECVVFEDAVNGVIAGKAAGMKVIGVNKNKEIREGLKKAKADAVFKNLNIPLGVI